jgi:low temperature requirement protein LtrA
MLPRSPDESHRTATTLELFFDLSIVIAVASAASGFHHQIAHGHLAEGLVLYGMMFFAVWWAWMNFTWFASAYDCDDIGYRIGVFVQIAGAVVIAAGIRLAFESGDFRFLGLGYTVMRVGLVAGWIRAGITDRERRRGAVTYAVGVTLCQIGWIALVLSGVPWFGIGFLLLVVLEMIVPIVAERRFPTPWHPEHISERYGLLTIIVLGESMVAIVGGVVRGVTEHAAAGLMVGYVSAGLVLVFCLWWLYFDIGSKRALTSLMRGFLWGYGHYVLFAAIAAAGGTFAAVLDHVIEHGRGTVHELEPILAITVAVLFTVLSLLRMSDPEKSMGSSFFLLAAAGLIAISGWLGNTHLYLAFIALITVVMTLLPWGTSRNGISTETRALPGERISRE